METYKRCNPEFYQGRYIIECIVINDTNEMLMLLTVILAILQQDNIN